VIKRLGCDYETLAKINPRIVYCSLSGYGQDGPWARMPGHDINYCAVAGEVALQRDEQGNPVYNGIPMADMAGGLHAALGILAALMAREKTGRGQFIDVTLAHSVMPWMTLATSYYFRDGNWPYSSGMRGHFGVVKCKDGRFLSIITEGEVQFWRNFCNGIGRPDFVPLHRRALENPAEYEEMVREIKAIMLTKTRDEWFEQLSKAECCIAPVLELGELYDHPVHKHRGMFLELDHPTMGKVRQLGSPIKFSDTPFEFRSFAPVLGEHTRELLREAGYPPQEVEHLIESGAVKAWGGRTTKVP